MFWLEDAKEAGSEQSREADVDLVRLCAARALRPDGEEALPDIETVRGSRLWVCVLSPIYALSPTAARRVPPWRPRLPPATA